MPEEQETGLQERINEITEAIITKSGVDGGYVQGIAITAIIFEAAYIAAGEVVARIGEEGMDLKAMQMEIAKMMASQLQVVSPSQSMASPIMDPRFLSMPVPNAPVRRRPR